MILELIPCLFLYLDYCINFLIGFYQSCLPQTLFQNFYFYIKNLWWLFTGCQKRSIFLLIWKLKPGNSSPTFTSSSCVFSNAPLCISHLIPTQQVVLISSNQEAFAWLHAFACIFLIAHYKHTAIICLHLSPSLDCQSLSTETITGYQAANRGCISWVNEWFNKSYSVECR